MATTWLPPIAIIDELIERALREDIGSGDVTTEITVPASARARGLITARERAVVAGLFLVDAVYRHLDDEIVVTTTFEEGAAVEAGAVVAAVQGSARVILTGERVALNLVQRLSGIATLTSQCVELIAGTKTRIVDTRKTSPGLRAFEKFAVRAGGGRNHRFGLFDAVLIKDNHIAACGSIRTAVEAAFAAVPHTMTVTVECGSLEQLVEAIDAGADVALLDNMPVEMLAEAVRLSAGRIATEASGGVTTDNVAAVAATGVDIISVGGLTHSARAIDFGLDLTLI